MYAVSEAVPELPASSVILMWNSLVPAAKVIEVLREVPSAVAWSSLDHAPPSLTDVCSMSSDAMAPLRVAVRVWAAVLVLKSESEVPVSAEMSTLLKLIVGAVVSRV